MLGILKTIFGDKTKKDLEVLQPIVEKVNTETEKIISISNDELRAKSIDFKKRIGEYIQEEENQIKELRDKVDTTEDINEKEVHFEQIDKINLEIDKKLEEILKRDVA